MFKSDKSVAGLVKLFTCVFLFRTNLRIACPNSEIFVSFQLFFSTRKTRIYFR